VGEGASVSCRACCLAVGKVDKLGDAVSCKLTIAIAKLLQRPEQALHLGHCSVDAGGCREVPRGRDHLEDG
jgi:hypothetical protein